MLLAQKSAATFNTRQIKVALSAAGFDYAPSGPLLSFAQMQALRKPLEQASTQLTLANLGVSAWLTVSLSGRTFLLLVKSPTSEALKLISGYVPTAHLAEPWPLMQEELSEECLIKSRAGWLIGRSHEHTLSAPYLSLAYQNGAGFTFERHNASATVRCQGHLLAGAPHAYIHMPTASLQLIYKVTLILEQPEALLAFEHVDEILVGSMLEVHLPPKPSLYLAELNGKRLNDLYQFADGMLTPVATQGIQLSEAFAECRDGFIKARTTSWQAARALF